MKTLLESFKDAQVKFSQNAPADEVESYLKQFRILSQKNLIKGPNKDIGKWMKDGWDEFKNLVDTASQGKSKTQVKKSVKKESITVYQDEEMKVVIPLTEPASCQYGQNTQWCTAYTVSDNSFVEYFHHNKVYLFYALMKNGRKYASATLEQISHIGEYFDDENESITQDEFREATGFGFDQMREWLYEHKDVAESYQTFEALCDDYLKYIIDRNPDDYQYIPSHRKTDEIREYYNNK